MLLAEAEIKEKIKHIDNWSTDGNYLMKEFDFESFSAALEFVNEIALLAEEADHHPDITISYKNVILATTTHSEGGITQKDFDIAREIDNI